MRRSKGRGCAVYKETKKQFKKWLISENWPLLILANTENKVLLKNVKLQTETDIEIEKPMFSMQTPKTQPKNIAATSSFESQTSLIIP